VLKPHPDMAEPSVVLLKFGEVVASGREAIEQAAVVIESVDAWWRGVPDAAGR
jgi:hypothetical protein